MSSQKHAAWLTKLETACQDGIVNPSVAAKALKTNKANAGKALAALGKIGLMHPIGAGLYTFTSDPLKLTTLAQSHLSGRIAMKAFGPHCYIAGWSAAELLGLAANSTQTVLVATTKSVRSREIKIAGLTFRLFRVRYDRFANARKKKTADNALVSSAEQTIADCLRDPELADGVPNLITYIEAYRKGQAFEPSVLWSVITACNSAAVSRRYGYLLDTKWPSDNEFKRPKSNYLHNSGYVKLDPTAPSQSNPNYEWHLYINVDVT